MVGKSNNTKYEMILLWNFTYTIQSPHTQFKDYNDHQMIILLLIFL